MIPKKDIKFISSMPRAGGTLLSVLLNQNKQICMTANSILLDMLYTIFELKNSSIYNNFPDHTSFDNVFRNVFNLYYRDWKASIIIDKGCWGTPTNLEILQSLYKKLKFIILYRPVLECLASYIRVDSFTNIDEHCEFLMNKNGRIGKELYSIKNILETKQDYHILTHKKLTTNPQLEIKKICKFIGLSSFKLNTVISSQLEINGVSYNDNVISGSFHKLKMGEIKYYPIEVEKILPKHIINKYKNMDI